MDDRFQLPSDLIFNTERVDDPASYARETGCVSWLYLNGPEFAAVEGGMSFDDVRAAVPTARNVISDPPRTLNIELARHHVTALDELPRPTLVTCRAGPRASAVVYMYAGLRTGTSPMDVVESARRDDAPCAEFPSYLSWIASSISTLRYREHTDHITPLPPGENQA